MLVIISTVADGEDPAGMESVAGEKETVAVLGTEGVGVGTVPVMTYKLGRDAI